MLTLLILISCQQQWDLCRKSPDSVCTAPSQCRAIRTARNSSSAAQKILSGRRRPSSQSICRASLLVCDPAAISADPSLSSGLPQTGHFPTIVILFGKGFYYFFVDQDSLLGYYIGLSIRLFELSTLSKHFFLGFHSTYHHYLEQFTTSFDILTRLSPLLFLEFDISNATSVWGVSSCVRR